MTEPVNSPQVELVRAKQRQDELTQRIARALTLTRRSVSLGQEPRFIYAKSEEGQLTAHWSVPHAGSSTRFSLEISRPQARELAQALTQWADQEDTVEQLLNAR